MKTSNRLLLSTSPLSQSARKLYRTASLSHRQQFLYRRTRRHHTGKEYDSETGLYYYGARYLDSKTGRWISGDPAMGDYVPSAPVNDEAKKRNGSLPGMGGVFNYVNLHVYHYAGNNPVKLVDPNGMWLNNGDGTFTAEKGDTLWGLQQETGRDWKASDYNGDPRKLQIGQTVSFATKNGTNNNKTIDSTREAFNQYFLGDGSPVNIGPNTIAALKSHPDQLSRQERIVNGKTTEPYSGNYGVDMTKGEGTFYIGRTRVDYSATYGSKFAVIDFTGFVQDGFWDVSDFRNKGDGLGPKYEILGGKPYPFISHSWTISVPNPRLK